MGKVDESFSSLLQSLAGSFSWPRGRTLVCVAGRQALSWRSQWKPDPLEAPHISQLLSKDSFSEFLEPQIPRHHKEPRAGLGLTAAQIHLQTESLELTRIHP